MQGRSSLEAIFKNTLINTYSLPFQTHANHIALADSVCDLKMQLSAALLLAAFAGEVLTAPSPLELARGLFNGNTNGEASTALQSRSSIAVAANGDPEPDTWSSAYSDGVDDTDSTTYPLPVLQRRYTPNPGAVKEGDPSGIEITTYRGSNCNSPNRVQPPDQNHSPAYGKDMQQAFFFAYRMNRSLTAQEQLDFSYAEKDVRAGQNGLPHLSRPTKNVGNIKGDWKRMVRRTMTMTMMKMFRRDAGDPGYDAGWNADLPDCNVPALTALRSQTKGDTCYHLPRGARCFRIWLHAVGDEPQDQYIAPPT